MSAVEFQVGHFDRYYDIPLRGVIKDRAAWLPFVAEVDQDAPDEAWTKGIPTTLHLFPKNEQLGPLYEVITTSFNAWNVRFRRGKVTEDTHPMKSDPDFKRTMALIDVTFEALHGRPEEIRGFFSVRDGIWSFRTDANGKP